MKRRQLLVLAGMAASARGFAAGPVAAYPVKPITIVVPFPPGGPTDGSARVFAKSIATQLGQPVVIENRAGAGGTVGTASVARAVSDGYTLLWAGTSGLVVAPALYANLGKSLRYDPVRSFEPIAIAVRSPMLLAGNNALKANTLRELVDESQKRVLSRSYVVTGKARYALLPDVPTVAELVGKPFESYSWFGLAAPSGTPKAVVRTLNAAMSKASQDPEVQKFVSSLGLESVSGSEEQFAAIVSQDFRKWSGVAARGNVRTEE
jgi:tripartite-type tricarboxylate transporter receptor subunit TctC